MRMFGVLGTAYSRPVKVSAITLFVFHHPLFFDLPLLFCIRLLHGRGLAQMETFLIQEINYLHLSASSHTPRVWLYVVECPIGCVLVSVAMGLRLCI